MRRALSLVGLWSVSLVEFVFPQQPVTRADAVAAGLGAGARAAFGRADTAAAAALLRGARLYPNPTLAATYTKDVPHYHVIADLPLDLPWLRAARIGAAAAARDAARYGFAFERAAIRFDVDTTYTRALATLARARLSRRNVGDADSLLKMAQLRREVGDVSELDVRLAAVNAGQLENGAADDSLAAVEALLAVQLAMALPGEQPTITLADSLAPPPDSVPSLGAEPLPVAAAALARAQREFAVAMARVQRDRRLLASADRVAAMSLQAYAEGAVALPNVLEAQRNAREALGRYVDDVAAASNAAAAVRLLTASDQP